MLSRNTKEAQGASLPPHESLITFCIFDKQFPRETIFLSTPYPTDTVQIHNLLFVMLDPVEQIIGKPVVYRHRFLGVWGHKANLSDEYCLSKLQEVRTNEEEAIAPFVRLVGFDNNFIAIRFERSQFWALFKKCQELTL